MKSPLRLAILACLFPAFAHASEPVRIDVFRELTAFQVASARNATDDSPAINATYGLSTPQVLASLLVDPASPYSEPIAEPDMLNEIWWEEFADRLATQDRRYTNEEILGALRWQTGLTKARPGIDVPDVSNAQAAAYRGKEAAAMALKAGVDSDIYLKAWDMSGNPPAVAAGYAVALQILRDQIAHVPAADHEAMGIKPEVFTRFMNMAYVGAVPEPDQRYLTQILRGSMIETPSPFAYGPSRKLPTIFRVARVAAAYSDASGYTTRAYCKKNYEPALPALDMASPDGTLCFVAATDRAVHRWYRRELRYQLARTEIHNERHESGFSKLLHFAGVVLMAIDIGAFFEVAEAAVADDLAYERIISDSEAEASTVRSNNLLCRISR